MGNKNLKSKKIDFKDVSDQATKYPYDVCSHAFKLALKFNSKKGIKGNLFRLSCLSTIHSEIQKTNVFEIEEEEKNLITKVVIEGPLTNIFSFGERVLNDSDVRQSFIDVSEFELLLDSKGHPKIWLQQRKVTVKILPTKTSFEIDAIQNLSRSPIEKMQKLGQNPVKFKEDLKEVRSPIKMEENEFHGSPIKVKESLNEILKPSNQLNVKGEEELKFEGLPQRENQEVKEKQRSKSSGKEVIVVEVDFRMQIPQKQFLGRCFYFDFYQTNSSFTKFAPVSMLVKQYYPDNLQESMTLATISLEEIKKTENSLELMSKQLKCIEEKTGKTEKQFEYLTEKEKKTEKQLEYLTKQLEKLEKEREKQLERLEKEREKQFTEMMKLIASLKKE
jgi:hypothetical protein